MELEGKGDTVVRFPQLLKVVLIMMYICTCVHVHTQTDTCVSTLDGYVFTAMFLMTRHFNIAERTAEEAAKLFSVPDFTGDACKAIASRIRGAVAQVQFDDFHKVSSCSCST